MAPLNSLLGAAAFLLLQVATCDNLIPRLDDLSGSSDPDSSIIGRVHVRNGHVNIIRDEGVTEWTNIIPREDGLVPGEVAVVGDKKYTPSEGANQAVQLDGRALLAEWMQPHGLSKRACQTVGWESCGGTFLSPSHSSHNVDSFQMATVALRPLSAARTPPTACNAPPTSAAAVWAPVVPATSAIRCASASRRAGRAATTGATARRVTNAVPWAVVHPRVANAVPTVESVVRATSV